MEASSADGKSAGLPEEDLILDLNEGPWPGPVERLVVSGDVHFGKHCLPNLATLQIKKHRRRSHWYRTSSATLVPVEIQERRWNYEDEVMIKEHGEGLLRGRCLQGKRMPDGSLELKFHDSSQELEHAVLNLVFFGMTNKEMMFWIPQFVGLPEPHVPGLTINTQLRPFIYAVPVEGLSLKGEKKTIYINDLGVVAGEADNTIYPIIEQLKVQEREPIWGKDVPKAFGVVMAKTFLEAEELGLKRASLTGDLVNFALRTAVSHWEDRRSCEALEWNRGTSEADVKLSNWILIREVQSVKGWIRMPVTGVMTEPIGLDNVYDRLMTFLDRFKAVSTVDDVASQAGRRQLSKNEIKLIDGIQRALHWYGIAMKERDALDKFLATWIALEATLDCISYPGVFDGERQAIKSSLGKSIETISYKKVEDPLLSVSSELMKGRLLASDWPLTRKLELFAKSFEIPLQAGDVDLVRQLGRQRSQALHGGKHEMSVTESSLSGLKYLTERLLIGASLYSYRKLEDKEKHTLHLLPIGPEGGAAPLVFDGKDAGYEFFTQRKKTGEQRSEWIIDGYVYDESNSHFA
jgi:hypothetical protein